MWIVFDIIVLAIILICIIKAKRKGFIKASYGILSLVITFALMFVVKETFTEFLKDSIVGESISGFIKNSVVENIGEGITQYDEIIDNMGLPGFFVGISGDMMAEASEATDDIVNNITDVVTNSILNVISVILLFIVIRISLYIVVNMLNLIAKLPGLNAINKLAGAFMGLTNGLFLVYLICAVMIIVVTKNPEIKEIIDNSTITKFFYENNLLMMIFK